MAITDASMAAKKRILAVCVKLFLEKGYNRTTVAEITKGAGVSISTFQNIFRAKDGVLNELVEFMFSNQFGVARRLAGADAPPVYVYAVETALQIVLTERNENLRDIYLEAYTQSEAADYIHKRTASELRNIFGTYLPGYSESDFYEMELGSAGIMRGYMARKCDMYFPLERKLRRFLSMSLRAYCVPEEEVEAAILFVEKLDIRTISDQVMQALFNMLAVHFEFSLEEMNMEKH
ncbi:MAG: helix-turn-helix domain-containing protein [Frisingicoccus sp.]|nr:helix-turn-helix domain-containing protein [Frisingicoccus sp.]